MVKSVQSCRREELKNLCQNILGNREVFLAPINISVEESFEDDFTTTNFSFSIRTGDEKQTIRKVGVKGKGFVDCLFIGLQEHFSRDFTSLEKIKLVDLLLDPIIKNTHTGLGSDSQATILFRINVEDHGEADFENKSRSLIYSSYAAALEAFEFYINCEACFNRLHLILEDAQRRNRADIIEKCKFQLSKITKVNTYGPPRQKN